MVAGLPKRSPLGSKLAAFAPTESIQLLEYQTDVRRCRFDINLAHTNKTCHHQENQLAQPTKLAHDQRDQAAPTLTTPNTNDNQRATPTTNETDIRANLGHL